MARTSARISLPATVDETTVAPHRYTWDGANNVDGDPSAMPYREWRKAQPYQPGDVVWIDRDGKAVRAYISDVFVEYDRYGDRRAKYRVHPETAKGTWSKLWHYTFPGYIQRGYLRAGLAPDCEGKDLIREGQ